MSVDALADAARASTCAIVEVTGGEPLLQSGVTGLLEALRLNGYLEG